MSDESKAAAEAEKAKAKADADAKKAEKRAAQVEAWRRLAARIAAEAPQNRVELIGDLTRAEGLKISDKGGTGVTKVTMHGITAGSTAGEINALINWGNAARRALLADA